ncbi:hypothetical protein ACLBWS_05855 [Brucellaceae bacterium D45D]
MDKIAVWLLDWAKDSPLLVFLIASALLAISSGPAYIKAISEAKSRKRHDDVLLTEKEQRLKKRIADKGIKND